MNSIESSFYSANIPMTGEPSPATPILPSYPVNCRGKKLTLSLSEHIQRMCQAKNNKMRKYKEIYPLLVANQTNLQNYEEIYHCLETEFRRVEHGSSPQAWVQRADLLDAIDFLVQHFAELPSLEPHCREEEEWKKGSVPVVSYRHIQRATDLASGGGLTDIEALRNTLGKYVKAEYTTTSELMGRITRPPKKFERLIARILELLSRVITWVLGRIYRHPPLWLSPLSQIAKFSLSVGLRPSEEVEEGSPNEMLHLVYHGPRFLFGKSVHDYKTVNEWFVRDLTSAAKQQCYTAKSNELEQHYGKDSLVVSPANCRVRTAMIAPGRLGEGQWIAKKVVSEEAEKQAQENNDSPVYYQGNRYAFSIPTLMGVEKEGDLLAPRKLKSQAVTDFKQKGKRADQVLRFSQHQLLGVAYRILNEAGAVEVFNRLAAEDLHNYCASLSGTMLSHREASAFFKEYLKGNQEEVELLDQLEEIFQAQEEQLGRPSQKTIDIVGTNASVSTPAIRNQPRILAQNDRKIAVFKHVDGSFSLHVYIGATGVNRVDVDPTNQELKRGDRVGDMGLGPDTYSKKGSYLGARNETTRDGIHKLRTTELKKLDHLGEFTPDGSTIISFFLPTDFVLLPEIEAFKEKVYYQERGEHTEVEVQVKMGDPLLVKTEVRAASILERIKTGTLLETLESCSLDQEKGVSEQDKRFLAEFQALYHKPQPTLAEENLIQRFKVL